MCVAGASIGKSMPCGDPMPVGGVLTAADRTRILDWNRAGRGELERTGSPSGRAAA
jgi:hypothetical protein